MSYIKSHYKQTWALPRRIEDLIPEDHICYLVESLIHSMNFTSFDEKYSGSGHPAYHPRILLKLLIMGMIDKVRSSRKLAKRARENIVYIYLAEKVTPNFRTISDFRKDNSQLIKKVFKHTVTLAKQAGALDLNHLSTDGTKLKANAANKHTLTKEELKFLLKFIDNELKEWAKQDELEDEKFGNLRGTDQLPNKSKKKMKRMVKKYVKKAKEKGNIFKEKTKQKLKKAHREVRKHSLDKVSVTDPESRFMENKKGRIEFSYNAQITTDKNGFVVANDICQKENDVKELKPQILQTKQNLEKLPSNVPWCFDNGYFEGGNLAFLQQKNIDGHVATQKIPKNPYSIDKFVYHPEMDEYTCPGHHRVTFLREQYDKTIDKTYRLYKAHGCGACPHQTFCTKDKRGARHIKVYPYRELRKRMVDKMQTTKAKETYRLRAEIVEPAFGDIKQNKGVREFFTRGLQKVKIEFNLVCIARNLKKIWIRNTNENKSIQKPQKLQANLFNRLGIH